MVVKILQLVCVRYVCCHTLISMKSKEERVLFSEPCFAMSRHSTHRLNNVMFEESLVNSDDLPPYVCRSGDGDQARGP